MLSLLFSATFVFLQLWDPSYGCDQLDIGKGVSFQCVLNGESISCEEATGYNINATGTTVYFKCLDGFERAAGNTGPTERTCLTNGSWSGPEEIFSCDPECGRISQDPVEVTLDGRAAKQVPVPWHAEIINLPTRENNYKQETVCYGTLISDSVVLTAAHCLYEMEGYSKYSYTDLRVVLGNRYSDLPRATTQIRKVTAFDYPLRFDLFTSTHNVAVLYLDEPVDINESVNRVCLPDGSNSTFFQRGNTGWVPAFRRSDDIFNISPILLHSVPYIVDEECGVNIPSYDRHAKYFDRISPEKFCGGVDDCWNYEINTDIVTEPMIKMCRNGWAELNDVCYHVSHEKTDWETARSLCQNEAEGAELASIHNDEQFTHVLRQMRYSMWIGLNSLEDQNSFVWSDGSDLDYQRWRRDEPNNLETQRCGEIVANSGVSTRECDTELHFACSIKADVCPLEWEKAGSDYCYMAVDFTATWEEARYICKAMHEEADLASFHNDEEFNAILGKTHEKVWIGLNLIEEEAGVYNWTWSDGTEFDYEKWSAGEPNFLAHERCAEVRKLEEETYGEDSNMMVGDWNNWRCSGRLSHVCAAPKTDIMPGSEDVACLTQIKRGYGYGMVHERNGRWYLEGVVSATYDSFPSGIIKDNTCRTDVQLFARVDNYLTFIKEAVEMSYETFTEY